MRARLAKNKKVSNDEPNLTIHIYYATLDFKNKTETDV